MGCDFEIPEYIRRTTSWNPWHGCHRVSEGCRNCYMFVGNDKRGVVGSNIVARSITNFDAPLKKDKAGHWVLRDVLVLTSMTSDFFIEEADGWRDEAWEIIRKRKDLHFLILTKRPERIMSCLPDDWNGGYRNVRLSVSVEDQESWDKRVSQLIEIPSLKHDVFIAPMIGKINAEPILSKNKIDCIYLGGEYGGNPRPCDYDWVTSVRDSCIRNKVTFFWRNAGDTLIENGIRIHFDTVAEQDRYSINKKLDVVFDDPLPKSVQTTLF